MTDQPPRMRDLPAPRDNPSVAGPAMRWLFTWPYRFALAGLYRARVRAWQLTVASLLANGVVGALLLTHRRLLPGLLLLPAGLLDIFDGGVARLRGEESKRGALLDSTLDRAADGIVLGCLFASEAMLGRAPDAVLALTAMVISLLVSHLRAEGEAMGLEMTEGTFQRLERYLALILGLSIPGGQRPALALLVILGVVTAYQRLSAGLRRLSA